MSKLKITVLKRQDPDEIFDELPVKRQDWMVPCELYKDGQEFIIDKLSICLRGFVVAPGRRFIRMLEPCCMEEIYHSLRREESQSLAAPMVCVRLYSSWRESSDFFLFVSIKVNLLGAY